MILAFHKPYGVLSRFTPDGSANRTLSEFGFPMGVHPVGRLDADSEGLLLLSDERWINGGLLDPSLKHPRVYLVQIEGIPNSGALARLSGGVVLKDFTSRPCRVILPMPQPVIAPREPPIRVRRQIPDCWIILEMNEGKNRKVRRMTAAVGHPTLRLIRIRIGCLELGDLALGAWKTVSAAEIFPVSDRSVHKRRGLSLKPTNGENKQDKS